MARSLCQNFIKAQAPVNSAPQWARAFSQSQAVRIDEQPKSSTTMENLSRAFMKTAGIGVSGSHVPLDGGEALAQELSLGAEDDAEPYHFHIFAHKLNTHITVTRPNRNAIISLSCGNIGFKKAQRRQYDAAYQLAAYVIDKLHQMNYHNKIKKLEVVLRGFGPGREAVTKALLGNEGRMLRDKIVKVSDSTRLKFGGTRGLKPKRLG